MHPELYNQRQVGLGLLQPLDLLYLWSRFPGTTLPGAVTKFQTTRGLTIDGKAGTKETIPALPTRTLRENDRESIIAVALLCTLPAQPYRWGKEVQVRECRLHGLAEIHEHVLGDWPASLPPVDGWDCSELVEFCAWACGVRIHGKPLRDGTWRQHAQLREAGQAVGYLSHREVMSARPGDLLFVFRDEHDEPIPCPSPDRRPARAHVAIVLSGDLHTIEAAPAGCGIYPPRPKIWTHAGRLIP